MRVETESTIGCAAKAETRPVHRRDRCVLHPDSRPWLEALGLTSAAAFLAYPGEILGGHVRRNVSRVRLPSPGGERIAYLKRDHSIRWRERFRHLREGYALSSKCEREARVLMQLETEGLDAPRCLAWGEDGRGRAFLLLEGATGSVPLRRFLRGASPSECREVAANLARFLAGTHRAGFTQPDLLPKHVLVDPETLACTVIDWQRSRRRAELSARQSQEALARLRLSLDIPPLLELRFLVEYCRSVNRGRADQVSARLYALGIGFELPRLKRSRAVREQRQEIDESPEQPLIWLDGEAICAVPPFAASLKLDSARDSFYPNGDRPEDRIVLAGRAIRIFRERRVRRLPKQLLSERRLRSLKPLRIARVAMHLERLGIPAPRALAFGHRHCSSFATEAFVALEDGNRTPLSLAVQWEMIRQFADVKFRAQIVCDAGKLVRRLHHANCMVYRPTEELFAMADGPASLRINALERLDLRRNLPEGNAVANLLDLYREWKERIATADVVRFLRSYLGLRRLDANAQRLIRGGFPHYQLRGEV